VIQRIVRYVCDFCKMRYATNSTSDNMPSGWSSLSGFYGEVAHACPRCRVKAVAQAKDEHLRIWPENMKAKKGGGE
jgi:hypothetical protein